MRSFPARSRHVCVPAAIEPLEGRTLLSATIYLCDGSDNLYSANTATGQETKIGNGGVGLLDIAENAQGQLFGVDGSGNLYSVNATTAADTLIGPLGTEVNSLAFSLQGTLYGANGSLYTISTSTGAATVVGSLGGDDSDGDLAFDNHGNLFLSASDGNLAKVNPTTGQATDIGPIGFPDIFALAFGSDGVMYGIDDDTSQVLALSLSTGTGTPVSVLSLASGAFGAASEPAAPSPQTPAFGHVKLPSAVVAGTKFTANVPVVITNHGTTYHNDLTVTLFAEIGTGLDGTQVVVASLKKKVSLKAGKSETVQLKLKSLPKTLAAGTYHLLAEVVNASGLTDVTATTKTVKVTAAVIKAAVSASLDGVSTTKVGTAQFTIG